MWHSEKISIEQLDNKIDFNQMSCYSIDKNSDEKKKEIKNRSAECFITIDNAINTLNNCTWLLLNERRKKRKRERECEWIRNRSSQINEKG